ncbi:hypothetical protein LU276_02660 [Moraxella haemolytica]|nr:hypothetical protein [Moraxella sp. ZY171148]WII95752.1 hypothetical protein LU276_02660 [Moraxella sp. ZY171148]
MIVVIDDLFGFVNIVVSIAQYKVYYSMVWRGLGLDLKTIRDSFDVI